MGKKKRIKIDENSILGKKFKEEEYLNTNNLDDAIDFEFADRINDKEHSKFVMPDPQPKLCPFCGEKWTAQMETLLVESGYCETCYDTDSFGVIICSKCKRIVYRK